MKVSDIGGEFELLRRIEKNSKIYSKDVLQGIGDDTAVLKYSSDKYFLITTDMLVENDHFSLKYFSAEQIGKKSIEVNVSDIASMGGIPRHALVSLALPKNISLEFLDNLYKGINSAARKYKISIIGGDTTHSNKTTISITMTGIVEKKRLCLRSHAKVNDLICVTGYLGGSTAGLNLLLKNKKGKSTMSHLEPRSRLDVSQKIAKYANAMEDVSDGLGQEIRNICKRSNTGAEIHKKDIPIKKEVFDDAKKVDKDAYDFALYGGEDFEIVFTITKKNYKKLKKILKDKITIIGMIMPKNKGIYILDNNKHLKVKQGYNHFK